MAVSKTQTRNSGGNVAFRDGIHSPAVGASMWEDAPLLAYMQDPSVGHLYYNDFHDYLVSEWTLTTTEVAGAATEVITDEAGGVLLVTNGTADNDSDEFQKLGEAYQLVAGKPLWLEGKFKVSEATQSDFFFGLTTTDTAVIDATQDGVWFQKDDGDANIDVHTDKDDTETTEDTGKDIAANTFVRLGIKFNGAGLVSYHINGSPVSTSTTNVPDDELMRITFAIQNGEASAKTMSCDFIKCFQIS